MDCKTWWKAFRARHPFRHNSMCALQLEKLHDQIPVLYDFDEFTRRIERLGTRRTRRLARLNVTVKLPKRPSILEMLGA